MPQAEDWRRHLPPCSASDIKRQLPNIKWLLGEQCNLDDALATLEKNIKIVSDSSRADELSATFGALRQPR